MSQTGESSPRSRPAGESTSVSLIQRVQEKERDAWRQLTELYGPLVYHWARSRDVDPHDSGDLVQEVFRSVAGHIETFERRPGEGSFRGWLWTITRNKIRDHWRRQISEPPAAGGDAAFERLNSLPVQEPPEEDESASNSLALRAAEMVRPEFHENTWQAFWRTTVDDISPAAVADELGMKIASVYQAKSRVLKRLREFLG